jgi:hypothetical protein
VNPSVGDGERAALLDDVVEVLSNGRGLLRGHLRVDFPKILRALSREMPHERTNSNHCPNTSTPRSSTSSQPRLRNSPLLPSSSDSRSPLLMLLLLGVSAFNYHHATGSQRDRVQHLKPFIHNS